MMYDFCEYTNPDEWFRAPMELPDVFYMLTDVIDSGWIGYGPLGVFEREGVLEFVVPESDLFIPEFGRL